MGPTELRQTSCPLATEMSDDSHAPAISHPCSFIHAGIFLEGPPCLTYYVTPTEPSTLLQEVYLDPITGQNASHWLPQHLEGESFSPL